jgi:hypothetical protein
MQHADELDDVVASLDRARQAGRPLDRARFRAVLSETLGGRALAAGGTADFLWRLFDADRDGFLSEAEVLRRVASDDHHRAAGPVAEIGAGGAGASATALVGASATVRRPPPRHPQQGRS